MRLKILLIPLVFIMFALPSRSQQMGMSFSFFFPRSGYFSNPVSPFSIRGLGLNVTNFFSFETGFSLYRMAGMNVTGLPFETNDPLMGPFFSMMVPLDAVIEANTGNFVFKLKGGGFAFYNFMNRINYGNLDRAIADYEGWQVANADFDFTNSLGYGYKFGGEIIIYFTKQFGINLEANYYVGNSPVRFEGKYTGGTLMGGLSQVTADYPDSKLDFTGLELTLGVLFSTR